jgi:proteasome assembly chaperone (PAC2) family protein
MKNLLFTVIAMLLTMSVQAQNGVTLKMNLEKNKVYQLRSVSDQTVTQTINGGQQTTESHVSYIMSLKMVDATPDFMITEIRFDTLITNTNAMGKVSVMSSAKEGDIKSSEMADVVSCIMNRLSKSAIYAKIDYSGKPVEIVNAGMLAEMILRDTAAITLAGPTGDAVKQQLAGMISAEELKTMIGMFTHNLPGREVSPGETWNNSQTMNTGGMTLDISTTYRFTGTEGDFAVITSESAIRAADNAAPLQSGGATVSYGDLKGLSRATMKVYLRTGLLSESTGKTRLSGNLGISGPGFSMQMPMDINGESTVKGMQ